MSLDDVVDRMIGRVESAATAFGERVRGEIEGSIQEAFPPASTPGSPPHRRTGKLAAACFARPAERTGDAVTVAAGNDAPYAASLEHGTDRMAARPFVAPVRERMEPEWRHTAADAARGR